jgi:DNA-binding XRE family transcriptional regulator
MGQTQSFGDVGPMSGLPESGHVSPTPTKLPDIIIQWGTLASKPSLPTRNPPGVVRDAAPRGYSFSSVANLNPNRASPPATMRATQLADFGTDQSPIMRGQSSKIRIRWNRATKVKTIPATVENVFRFIERPSTITLLFGRAERVAALRRSFYRVQAMSNIVSGRQIRAARMLAGLTQADLARAAGCHPRSVRYWENKGSNPPTNVASTLDSIEQALNRHGVIPFSTPTPGVRCSS